MWILRDIQRLILLHWGFVFHCIFHVFILFLAHKLLGIQISYIFSLALPRPPQSKFRLIMRSWDVINEPETTPLTIVHLDGPHSLLHGISPSSGISGQVHGWSRVLASLRMCLRQVQNPVIQETEPRSLAATIPSSQTAKSLEDIRVVVPLRIEFDGSGNGSLIGYLKTMQLWNS